MVVDGTYAKMWIADGIFYFIYKPIPILDLPKAKTIVQERFVVQNQVNYPIFCDLRGVQQSVKEARDYLANEGAWMTKALALLVEDPHAYAISKMYVHMAKGDYPTQIFTDREKALEFLETNKKL